MNATEITEPGGVNTTANCPKFESSVGKSEELEIGDGQKKVRGVSICVELLESCNRQGEDWVGCWKEG